VAGTLPGTVYFKLIDLRGTGLPGPGLQAQPYGLSSFSGTEFYIGVQAPGGFGSDNPVPTYAVGRVTAMSLVPEPITALLLALAAPAAPRRKHHTPATP
jgi:hypothetical protein